MTGQPNTPPELILTVNKPLEWTSFDVVNRIKYFIKRNFKEYKNLKIGHAGTLDPLATGVLVVCIGKATKKIESLQQSRKTYVATIRLGATTPSYDLETEIDATFDTAHITEENIRAVATSFIGEQIQYPPIFSAKKLNGVRAYELARAGETLQMRGNLIEIFDFKLTGIQMPDITVEITCSKGTYIRSIAHDFGKKLENGAHLAGLCRTASGEFTIEKSMNLDETTDYISSILSKN